MTLFLSRGMDYLGALGAKLRDLRGYRTLAQELIQNADDAGTATRMWFRVSGDALVVDNNGVFSDCGKAEGSRCAWLGDETGTTHQCDFHRFRVVAAADKRRQVDTIGAFGIGFTTVYQVTDNPELISAGRHWILDETAEEGKRIRVCNGCPVCSAPDMPGTRIILPWVRNNESALRQALKAEAIEDDTPSKIVEELRASLGAAMLFLKHLHTISLSANNRSVLSLERVREERDLLLHDGIETRTWHVITGTFADEAVALKLRHAGRIEEKRHAAVTLAVPLDAAERGLLCAFLPTEQDLGLPFHLNADFYPSSDRKRIVLENDYQSEWNRAALRAGATALAGGIHELTDLLGGTRFWEFASTIKQAKVNVGKNGGEGTAAIYWDSLAERLRGLACVPTTAGRWVEPSEALLLLSESEAEVLPVLEDLGLAVVPEELRSFQSVLHSNEVGVRLLEIDSLCAALRDSGMNVKRAFSELPTSLRDAAGRNRLWNEVRRLLDRVPAGKRREGAVELLESIALAPADDDSLWPPSQVYRANPETIRLFRALGVTDPFAVTDGGFGPLAQLCPEFDLTAAIEELERIEPRILLKRWQEQRYSLAALFEWLDNYRAELRQKPALMARLAGLSIYPASGSLYPATGVSLPGNFKDPLGLAELVDLTETGGHGELLRVLGMRELTFEEYVIRCCVVMKKEVSHEKRQAFVDLLAEHLGTIRDAAGLLELLQEAPLVRCNDGEFRAASECYFDSDAIRRVLGHSVRKADIPAVHHAAIRGLYEWIGVASVPRTSDVVSTVERLRLEPYSPESATHLQEIVNCLAHDDAYEGDLADVADLKTVRWLPARGRSDRWYAPTELWAEHRAYLFESQAAFIDIERRVQSEAVGLFAYLGIKVEPTTELVVAHLRHCVKNELEPNSAIYQFLNEHADEAAVGRLAQERCLWLTGRFRRPSEAVWGAHEFGRFRTKVSEALRDRSRLLDRLGVRQSADWTDAFSVLQEISLEIGARHLELDAEALAVTAACWRMLESALKNREPLADRLKELEDTACIPHPGSRMLRKPWHVFFENRAGLAEKFGELFAASVIARPTGASVAYEAAGVRNLSDVVATEIVELADPVDDHEMMALIRNRRDEIARVFHAVDSVESVETALDRLETVRCFRSPRIEIRLRASPFNKAHESETESVQAIYDLSGKELYSTRFTRPWATIARELTVAAFPTEDPGKWAAGLKEVLAADTEAAAREVLDDLGFPRSESRIVPPPAPTEAETLGGDVPVDPDNPQTRAKEDVQVNEREEEHSMRGLKKLPGGGEVDVSGALTSHPPSSPIGGPSGTRPKRKGRQILRTYVLAGEDTPAQGGPSDPETRADVDRRGIAHVIAFEQEQGRSARSLPHTHPGYDIESRGSDGEIVRLIEVKSLSGIWADSYAVLSRTQFDKAIEAGDVFWLYVVENAISDEPTITPIHNPPAKANHFMFDSGWVELADYR